MNDLSLRLLLVISLAASAVSSAFAQTSDFPSGPIDYFRQDSSSYDSKKDPWLDNRRAEEERLRVLEERKEEDARRNATKPANSDDALVTTDAFKRNGNSSNFHRKSFIDSDFNKTSYTDLFINTHNLFDGTTTDDRVLRSGGDHDSDESTSEKFKLRLGLDLFSNSDDDMQDHDDDYRTWKTLMSPVPGMFHDWVPDKVDPLQNGGFTIAPDNGSPVPYHLNGHPDLERGLPWAK